MRWFEKTALATLLGLTLGVSIAFATDTNQRRTSALSFGHPGLTLPSQTSSLTLSDKAHLLGLYSDGYDGSGAGGSGTGNRIFGDDLGHSRK